MNGQVHRQDQQDHQSQLSKILKPRDQRSELKQGSEENMPRQEAKGNLVGTARAESAHSFQGNLRSRMTQIGSEISWI